MKTRYLSILLMLILTLAACGPRPQSTPEGQADPGTPAQPPVNATSAPAPARPTPAESALPQPQISLISPVVTPMANPVAPAAVAYLAAELGISSENVTILVSEAVQWPDASLGCSQPGMIYAPVLIPGYRFLLQAEEKEYEVHTDQTGQNLVICQ